MTRPLPLSQVLLGVGQQVGQALSNLGNIYTQRQAAQGQGIKQQLGAQVAQAEGYLADPNYKWDEAKRTATENFVNKGREFLAMDDMAVPAAYQQFMEQTKGGAMLPQTAVRLGNAGRPMTPQTTLTPYQGGIAGLLGDTGQGVAQQTQARAEKEKDLDLLRQMRLNGQQQDFTTARDKFLHKNDMTMAEFENELGMQATQQQLDVQNSATAADRIISTLTGIGSTTDPKNKTQADAIMERARNMGLQPYDLGAIETTYQGLGSGTASLAWKNTLLESGMNEQAVKLGEQSITLNGQQIALNTLMKTDQEYLMGRRHVEDGLSDATQFETIFAEAVANGDDKEIDDYMSILEGGGSVSPALYQAMTNSGVTLERLQEVYGDALSSDAFRAKKNSLDMTEMDLARNQLFRADQLSEVELRSAQLSYGDQVAHAMTPKEIDAALADPRSSLSMLTSAGILTESDIGSMRTRAGSYAIVRRQEQNAPRIEQKLKLLEMLAAVPADDAVAENSLRSALGELADYGMLQDDQVEGLVSGFRNQWTTGRQMQNAELAATLQNTSYQQVLMDVQKNDLMGVAAEGDIASLSDRWDMYREAYDQQLSMLKSRGDAIGCGGDGISMSEEDKASCKSISAEIGRLGQQQKATTVELVGTLGPDGEATFMQQQVARIQANVLKDPQFANASHLDIARAVNNRLQRQGFPPLNPAALEDAAAKDAAENPVPEGAAQPAAAAPARGPLGILGATQGRIWPWMSPNDAIIAPPQTPTQTTSQALRASGASASSGGSVAGGSTAQAGASNIFAQRARTRPAPSNATAGQGVTQNLRQNRNFTTLVSKVSQYGNLVTEDQQALVAKLEAQTGLPGAQLLELARLESTGSPSNPVPAPLYRQRAAARGQ